MTKKFISVRFHVFDLEFTPYKKLENKIGSFNILKDCIQKCNDEKINNQKLIVLDRFENRSSSESRKLFLVSAAYKADKKIYKCKMGLFRDKVPSYLDLNNFKVTDFQNITNKKLIEITNFYIDFDKINNPTFICEFNNQGARISDIEYYFRSLSSSKHLYLARGCKALIHMNKSIDDLLDSVTNIFKFRIRVKPENLPSLYRNSEDAFISNLSLLGKTVDPSSIKVDLSFRDPGGKKIVSKQNYKMLSTTQKILNAAKGDITTLEDLDDFYIEYEDSSGTELSYNFIKEKVEIEFDCLTNNSILDKTMLYETAMAKYFRQIKEKKQN